MSKDKPKIITITTPTDVDGYYREMFDRQKQVMERLHLNEPWIPRCPECGREGSQPCIPCASGETS
jgi:hypothetical protein